MAETNNIDTVEAPNKRRKALPFIIGGVAIVALIFGFRTISHMITNEDTENSQIECNIVPIAPRVAGYINEIRVDENQRVHKGDTMVKLDDRDLKIRVQQAQIALANARAGVDVSGSSVTAANASAAAVDANIATAEANVQAAQVRVWKATQDFNRYTELLNEKSVTQQQFDVVKAEKETAEQQVKATQMQLQAAREQSGASTAQAGTTSKQVRLSELTVEQRQAELDMAKLNLSYAYLIAPCDGYVSRKNIQVGQLVNAGQSLFSVVDDGKFWITANFKETQIRKIKVGQPVEVKVDAYPSEEFIGTVESIEAATGAKFSLLPPDNSSGNFVKVVQRVPVRIALRDDKKKDFPLRAGMNVNVDVRVKE
jgi:membrane fusion protein, multidrug efflux system